MIRLSVQDRLLPGDTLAERARNARGYGFDAIELSAMPVHEHAREAVRDGITVSAMCAGYRGFILDRDPEARRMARADIKRLLEVGAELGAGLIVVPVYGASEILPGYGTGRTREEDEAIFLDAMRECADHAERVGGTLILEAINRYETVLCITVADSLRYRELIGSPAVRSMGDVFHMNIEESDVGGALADAGEALGYVHLADNQRLEPGQGHLDFHSVFAGLARIGYDGYASLECSLSGRAEEVLPRTVEFLRSHIDRAG